ncbi:MAG: stage II sporulation protein M [Planctomycetes bacterium]|nr:stage II sporulation protein M [Planctomycetota bacterium]
MNLDRFVARNQQQWQALEGHLKTIEQRGPHHLDAEALHDFALLYRKAADDLAYARTFFSDSKVTEYLNHVVGRVHPLLYSRTRRSPVEIVSFFRRDFPRAFRRSWRSITTATGIFLLAAVVGYLGTWQNPTAARRILPARIIQSVDAGRMWTDDVYAMAPGDYLSAKLFTNNIAVTFALLALGMTAGVGTVFLLGLNGLTLGAAGGLCHSAGMGGPFWSFVAAHGPLELLVVFIAGGAGLELAMALVAPGQWRRGDALRLRGARAVKLVLGSMPLLVVAGVVEGVISGGKPLWVVGGYDMARVACGLALVGAVLAYLLLAGRSDAPSAAARQSLPRALMSR